MNDKFQFAINIVLHHEGGYSNDPDDPGGETNFGITQSDLNEHRHDFPSFPAHVKDLTQIEAEYFYKKVYWNEYNYDAIISKRIATKIFDMAVNMGAHEAHKLAQNALSYCGYSTLIPDGILGIRSMNAINEIYAHGRENDLMAELVDESKWFYEHLVEEKPKLHKFLNDWLERASWS